MTCDEVRMRLIDLAYDEPAGDWESAADRSEFERHVAQCEACAKALAELAWTRDVVTTAAVTAAGTTAGRTRQIHAGQIQRVVAQRAETGRRRWRRLAWLATAAAVLVAVGALSRMRVEIHPSHVVLAWGDSQPSITPGLHDTSAGDGASGIRAVSVQSLEDLKDSVAGHHRRLAEINRLMDLVVTELKRNDVRFAATRASFVRRIDAVERQNNERWRAVGRGFHDWYLERALAEATPASATVKGE